MRYPPPSHVSILSLTRNSSNKMVRSLSTSTLHWTTGLESVRTERLSLLTETRAQAKPQIGSGNYVGHINFTRVTLLDASSCGNTNQSVVLRDISRVEHCSLPYVWRHTENKSPVNFEKPRSTRPVWERVFKIFSCTCRTSLQLILNNGPAGAQNNR